MIHASGTSLYPAMRIGLPIVTCKSLAEALADFVGHYLPLFPNFIKHTEYDLGYLGEDSKRSRSYHAVFTLVAPLYFKALEGFIGVSVAWFSITGTHLRFRHWWRTQIFTTIPVILELCRLHDNGQRCHRKNTTNHQDWLSSGAASQDQEF